MGFWSRYLGLKSNSHKLLQSITTINQLKQFHAQLIHHSLHQTPYWSSNVIIQSTRLHAPLCYTSRVFDSTAQPDAFLFSNMFKYYSKWSSNNEILELFKQMQECGLKPDISCYPILIKSFGKNGVLFHAMLVKDGNDSGKYVRNGLVHFYGKYGPIENARKVFDEMSERSVVDWNAIISGYWNWGFEDEAKGLFDLMSCKNVITWTSMVTGYAKIKDLGSARMYFDRMPERNVVSWNAMLSGYAQNGFFEEALGLFNEMVDAGVSPNDTTCVALISSCSSRGDPELARMVVKMVRERGIGMNSYVKTAVLDLYAKCGRIEMARKVFDELGACGGLVAWNSMISGYMRSGDLVSAREMFDRMTEKDVVSWNSMIAGYAQNGQSPLAIELFKEMVMNGVLPDEVTMVSVISACGHLGAFEQGNWVAGFIAENHINLSISGYNSLIFMYSRCGSMEEANATFQEMESRDVISYNTLITGFATHGNGHKALKLMQQMKDEGIEPDRITYIGVLTACSHAGMVNECKKVFETIKTPDIDHYACMVDVMGRLGKLDEAKRIIEEMPMSPHAGIYGSLLNASRLHKRIEIGELAAEKLFELEPENSGNYVLLSNIYASMGKWKKVDKVRELMKIRGVTKIAGHSWVEYDLKVHRFMVGDRAHEHVVDIYSKLQELETKMRCDGYVADRSNVLTDVEEEEKEQVVGTHSEKLAVAFALLVSAPGSVIRVVKNLRICWDCHTAIKMISKLEKREIIVRDNNRFHCFKNNACSCNDYW